MSQLPSVELQTKSPTYRKRGGELTLLATTFMYSLYVWCTVGELYCTECTHSCGRGREGGECDSLIVSHMEEVILEGPIPVQSRMCTVGGLYLIKFLFGNLSYNPCSEPSRTVLLDLDVMFTMYARHPS